ncbi:TMV resistance protein N-like protein isoform X1 [Tanacetum coccineum]
MASSSSTPASSSQKWIYDVFLSFRGQDTRKTFIDHLYSALKQKGIYTYKDDETLQRGESIAPSLLKAIRESRIAVVVFSENYADSSWCLDELEYIMKCMDEIGQIVLPIFYHVEPSQVRKQKGEFGKGFATHELSGNNNKVESWRNALVAAANISGWETMYIANGHEAKCISEIVNRISDRLPSTISNVDEEFIGLRTRMQQLKSELEIGSGGVRMIGIWGIGGGGKTTLASCVYDEIYSMFDKCHFLENIRENYSKNGLESLQERILEEVGVGRVEEGKRMIKRRLSHASVLIVLDDVDDLAQLEALAGSHDWFGEGSRILITTRDNHVLNRVDVIHNICLLNNDEAIKLFRKHAPQGKLHMEDYEHFSKKLVHYASGLPLALKVLGCFLCDKDMNEWRSALARLKEIPDYNIVEKLKISFDGLTTVEKDLFLDIACLYRRQYKVEAMAMLEACEMGHYIVRGEHSNNPLKHSRVWKVDDVRRICDADTKMELDKIEAIRYANNDTLPSHVDASMTNLRSVELNHLCGSSLPTYLLTRELRCLNLWRCEHRQLWEGYKVRLLVSLINE